MAIPEENYSPDNNFKLVITNHPTKPGCWDHSIGSVFKKHQEDWEIVCEIHRNYSDFWYHWMTHKNGKRYLWCGEDYQGYTLIDLSLGSKRSYSPAEALMGFGFCWTDVIPNHDGTILAVDGCYWGAPWQIKFYDFSDPDQWPLIELGDLCYEGIHGWEDNQFVVSDYRSFRKSDGADIDLLFEDDKITDDEYDILMNDKNLFENRLVDRHLWTQPSWRDLYLHSARQAKLNLVYAEKYKEKYTNFDRRDLLIRLQHLWNKLEDRTGLESPEEIIT